MNKHSSKTVLGAVGLLLAMPTVAWVSGCTGDKGKDSKKDSGASMDKGKDSKNDSGASTDKGKDSKNDSGASAVKGKVSGKVKVGDKTVKFGQVIFNPVSDPNSIFAGQIEKDGTYRILTTPTGKYYVTVASAKPREPNPGFDPSVRPTEKRDKMSKEIEAMKKEIKWKKENYVPIPEDYSDPRKKNLVFEIKQGDNIFDIHIKE